MIRLMDEPADGNLHRTNLIRAIALPLVVLGLAYVLWRISDRLVWIGPFDRATFGWAIVIPVWLSAPIVAGVAWRAMPDSVVRLAAPTVGIALAAASGWLLWKAIAFPGCTYGSNLTPAEMALPAGITGLVLGGGVAAAGLIARNAFRRYAVVPAIGLGVVATVIAFVVTFFVAVAVLMNQGCQRPPVG